MSTNLDRFHNATPEAPIEVGTCRACSGTIYDYELMRCGGCEEEIHKSCAETCDECGHDGCKACLTETEDGLLLCEACKPEPESEKPVTLVDVVRAATEKMS